MARLSDDEPVALLKEDYGCLGTGIGPFLFEIFRVAQEGEPIPLDSIGQASAQVGAPITWALPGFDKTAGLFTGAFDFDSGWGVIWGYSTVQVALTPTSSALSTVWSSPAPQVNPAARDDIVVWSDYSAWSSTNRSKLRVYTPSGGTAILLQGMTGDVVESALTAGRIVWLEATGVLAGQGHYESAQLFWSPKTTNPVDVQRNAGPTLPHTVTAGMDLLTAFGDYGAKVVSFVENGVAQSGLSIGHLLTGKTWFIPARQGHVYTGIVAMNASWILLKEYTKGGNVQYVERIVRLDLAKLDQLSAGGY